LVSDADPSAAGVSCPGVDTTDIGEEAATGGVAATFSAMAGRGTGITQIVDGESVAICRPRVLACALVEDDFAGHGETLLCRVIEAIGFAS
jgi:hypothetical protein